jgi:hypothetical protein
MNATKAKKKHLAKPAKKKLDFNYRLLAFGALASTALAGDILNNSKDRNLQQAVANFQNSTPANFADKAQKYLLALGFPPGFVNAPKRVGMPWDLINFSGIQAISAVLEADSRNYPDGGCLEAIIAALAALGPIKP